MDDSLNNLLKSNQALQNNYLTQINDLENNNNSVEYNTKKDTLDSLKDPVGTIGDSINNLISNTYDISKVAAEKTRKSAFYLDRTNNYLSELVNDSNNDINELKIQKDNKKRIIEMQRNRLQKYKFIKDTLLYLLGIILICGVLLYIEKIFGSIVKPFSSILLVLIISIFIIFLVFRYVDYSQRSKFNFRNIDQDIGGDKYKKTVYKYDHDELEDLNDDVDVQSMGDLKLVSQPSKCDVKSK